MNFSCDARIFAVPCSRRTDLMRAMYQIGGLRMSSSHAQQGHDCSCADLCGAPGNCMTLHTEQRRAAHVFGGLVGIVLAAGLHVGGDERGRVNRDEVDSRRAAADGLCIPPEQRRQLCRLLIPAILDAQAGAEHEQIAFAPHPRSWAQAAPRAWPSSQEQGGQHKPRTGLACTTPCSCTCTRSAR